MKTLNQILLILFFILYGIYSSNGQIISYIESQDVYKPGSKKIDLNYVVKKHTEKFIKLLPFDSKSKNICFVVNIVGWDENKQMCLFSVSYIRNRSEIKLIDAFGYIKVMDIPILIKSNDCNIKKKIKNRKITQKIINKIEKNLSNDESNPLGYCLYEPDYMVIELNKDKGINQIIHSKMVDKKYMLY